ncbi:MAG TPA: methionyl-tRNA formyltransferase [Acidobacteriaceae bacterium]
MKLVFCGTPEFAVPTLEALIPCHDVALVVTQPDRAAGRGMETHAPPVKRTALAHDIPVLQPEKIKANAEFRAQLESIRPDAIIVVAYGRIIPKWMLDLPPLGNINLHGSLLPKYRGAAPIQWAVANGEPFTGVTTMRIDEGLDTGPMLLAELQHIAPHETAIDVYECLADVGARLMIKTLHGLGAGIITPVQQDHAVATLAPILKREDGIIDFTRPAATIHNRWRGFQPWPGAHTLLRGKKLIAHRMHIGSATSIDPCVLHISGDQMIAGCGDGNSIVFDEVQMEGKRRMPAAEFLRGFQLRSGERLGS